MKLKTCDIKIGEDKRKLMIKLPEIDLALAHKYFSVNCYNRAWDLMDKQIRTEEEDEQMLQLSIASHWHWTQREDYAPTNASIGYWQTSRIYALLKRVDEARRYAELCLQVSKDGDLAPFYQAYAYEALARAESIAGNQDQVDAFLRLALQTAEQISEEGEKDMLVKDLMSL
jgi:tetratricopeptide (TPR) repeat protein